MVDIPTVLDSPDARIPERKHPGDAGADLASVEDVVLGPGERVLVHTGVHVELPEGTLMWVVPRSGLAARHGLTIVNAPGLVDSGYRGEIMVCLLNTGDEPFEVHKGDRIAQAVVQRFEPVSYVAAGSLSGSDRGSAGFGSTGLG